MEKSDIRIDLSKYAGTYSLDEIKKVSESIGKDIFEAEKKQALIDVKKMHGDKYTYEFKKGTSVDLTKLKDGQRVCASGVKGHHILMTEIKN
jgi:hypothetical protein